MPRYFQRRLAGTPRPPARQRMLGYRAVIMFTAGLAVVTFLWRMVVPVGFYIPYLWLPSESHLPQYISMFVIGPVAVRRGWLTSLPPALGRWGLAAALVGALVLYGVSLVGGQDAAGGANVTSLLFTLFRQHFNSMGRWGAFLSQHAYAVFVTHAPVVVCVGIALRGVTLPPIVKFAIAVVLAVPLCFLIAAAVRKIPGARKVL